MPLTLTMTSRHRLILRYDQRSRVELVGMLFFTGAHIAGVCMGMSATTLEGIDLYRSPQEEEEEEGADDGFGEDLDASGELDFAKKKKKKTKKKDEKGAHVVPWHLLTCVEPGLI